jgi:hypothetical protein
MVRVNVTLCPEANMLGIDEETPNERAVDMADDP